MTAIRCLQAAGGRGTHSAPLRSALLPSPASPLRDNLYPAGASHFPRPWAGHVPAPGSLSRYALSPSLTLWRLDGDESPTASGGLAQFIWQARKSQYIDCKYINMIRYARYHRSAEIGLGNVPHTAFQDLLSCQMFFISIQTPGLLVSPRYSSGHCF